MSTVVEVARVTLVLVFAVAGIAKLGSREATREAVAGFGLPRPLVAAASSVLPAAELSLAVLLLVPGLSRWGAVAAVALLASFSLAIGAVLVRGRRPACNCFGVLRSRRIGPGSLGHNAVLIAVALLAAQPAGRGGALAGSPVSPVAAVLGALVVLEGLLVWQLFGQNRRLLERLDLPGDDTAAPPGSHRHARSPAPPVGSPAPDFRLRAPGGIERSLRDLLDSGAGELALVFADPGCAACDHVIEHLASRPVRPGMDVVVVASSGAARVAALLEKAPRAPLVLAGDEAVGVAYGIGPVPSAVLVDRRGTVASSVVIGKGAVLR